MVLPVGLWSAQLPVEDGELCLCKIKFLLALGCCMLCIFVWLAEIPESGASGALHWCCHLEVIFFLVIAYLLI